MAELLFKFVGNFPVPIFDTDASGELRQADGKTYFSIRQAARKCKRSAKELRELYNAGISELVTAQALAGGMGSEVAAAIEEGNGPADVARAMARLSKDERYRLAVRRTVCQHLDDQMFEDFMEIAQSRGLDPLKRQIYPRTRFNDEEKELEVIGETTIDGFAALAGRDSRFNGIEGPFFQQPSGEWTETWSDPDGYPKFAKAIVHVKGRAVPVVAVVGWKEFAPYEIEKGQIVYDKFWEKMPSHMLGKVARAHAYRRALPECLSGLYIGEELAAMDREKKNAEIAAKENEQLHAFDDSYPQSMQSLRTQLMNKLNLSPADVEHRIEYWMDRLALPKNAGEEVRAYNLYAAIVKAERRRGNAQLTAVN